jgi:act minimal PKS acyl carrier protein
MTDLLTPGELSRFLREDAGADLDGDALDREFDELGFDSIALLETVSRIEREYGVALGDSVVSEARTPRALIGVVNDQLRTHTD